MVLRRKIGWFRRGVYEGSRVARFLHVDVRPPARRPGPSGWLDRLAAAVLVIAASGVALYGAEHSLASTLAHSDFAPFYCAGKVARSGQDPNLAAPIAACERAVAATLTTIRPLAAGEVNPAPVPGYDVALVSLLSLIPYPVAAPLWDGLIVIAILLTVSALRRLTGLPSTLVAASLIGTEVVACLVYGQLAPFATLALSVAALNLARDRPKLAALAVLFTMIQPQIGLAAVAASFLWAPRTRWILLLGCAALGLIALGAAGVDRLVEYARVVLPQQAAAEVPFRIQYSLAWILFAAGVDEPHALQFGAWDYAATFILSVALAGRIAKALGPEAIVTFPAAAVLLGGTYVHQFQLSATVPFALILVARAPELRALAWTALALLAIPWQDLAARSGVALGALAVVVVAASALRARPALARGAFALVALALFLTFPRFVERLPSGDLQHPPTAASFAALGFDPAQATEQHGIFVREQPGWTSTSPQVIADKAPLWVSLLILVTLALLAALPRQARAQNFQALAG